MAYRVWQVKKLDGTEGFKVAWETKDPDNKSVYRFIKQAEWPTLGFSLKMTLEEAKAWKDTLNAKEKLIRLEDRKVKTLDRVEEDRLVHLAYLPEALLVEFETKVLELPISSGKISSYWKACKDTLCAVRVEPVNWYEQGGAFYAYFKKRYWSPAYTTKLIPLLNKWGKFLAKRTSIAFLALPFPKGKARREIEHAWRARPKLKNGKGTRGNKKSAPLPLSLLKSKVGHLQSNHYNWLLLSCCFALRPHEVDRLHEPEGHDNTWRIDEDGEVPVLWIYQSKLEVSVSDEKLRWKYIPCITPDQVEALAIIRSGDFKQPIAKTMRAHFGDKISAYGGRKAFTQMMKGYGQTFEDIASWMGHKSIDRTFKDYHDKQVVSFTKVVKAA